MEYLLDTINLADIKTFTQHMPISGVTSNPSIIKKEGQIDFFSHMNAIRDIIGDMCSLHIQVSQKDYPGMMKDAEAILKGVDDQVYIKVPVTMDGVKAIKNLKAQGIHVTATAVYLTSQAFIACEAGADYVAPYYNRMEAMGIDAGRDIQSIADCIERYGYKTKILAASFKNVAQINQAIGAGAQAITSAPNLYKDVLTDARVADAVEVFCSDWTDIYGNCSIANLKDNNKEI